VPRDEHCLITHTINDILVVPRLLRAGSPAAACTPAPAPAQTMLQKKRPTQTLHRVWEPNSHPSTSACRLAFDGAGGVLAATLFIRLSSPHGQKALPNLGSSTWQNNIIQLLCIQT